MNRIIFLLIAVTVLTSCVTNRKIQYLQKDDVNLDYVPHDTITRSYHTQFTNYKIHPEDILSVRVESLTEDEYNFFARSEATSNFNNISQTNAAVIGELVDQEGNIEFPVVGRIHVAGLTIYEAQDLLQDLSSRYLENPIIKVRMLNFRVTILGEVKNEGTIPIYNNKVSLMEAIGLAGGLTDLASRSDVKLIRQNGNISQVLYVDLLSEDLLESPYYYLHQNDLIIVPPLKQRPFRTSFGTNLSLILTGLSTVLLTVNIFTK